MKRYPLKQISIDPQHHGLYLQFSGEKITKTIEHTDFISIDLDKKGRLVGIEFVGVKKIQHGMKHIFLELAKAYNLPELKRISLRLKTRISWLPKGVVLL